MIFAHTEGLSVSVGVFVYKQKPYSSLSIIETTSCRQISDSLRKTQNTSPLALQEINGTVSFVFIDSQQGQHKNPSFPADRISSFKFSAEAEAD